MVANLSVPKTYYSATGAVVQCCISFGVDVG